MSKSRLRLGDITQQMLREDFDYDPLVGKLCHRRGFPGLGIKPGDEAGTVLASGRYRRMALVYRGVRLMLHRAIWMREYGAWPAFQIDHINGDALDNRLANLRDVSASTNMENLRCARSRSRTGLLGVSKHHDGTKPFAARIWVRGAAVRLGYFETAEAAQEAYLEAKRRLHAGCTV